MVTSIINESKIQERRSKTFTNVLKNDINCNDVSKVKFYSFTPFQNISRFDNNSTDAKAMIPTPNDSVDISFIPKNINNKNNKHFKSIDKSDYFPNKDLFDLKDNNITTTKKENESLQEKQATLNRIKKLDPISETSNDKVGVLLDSCRTIDLTKDDVDTIILNFALNSESAIQKDKNTKDKLLGNSNDIMKIGDKTITTGNRIFSFNSKLQKYWFAVFIKTGVILERIEIIIYENFCTEVIGRENFDFNNPIPPKTFSLRDIVRHQIQQIKRLLRLNYLRVQIRYRRNPYSTLFFSSLLIGTILPVTLFLMTLFTMATSYFLIYMSFFIIFGFISSFLIIPLLSTSFIFAIGVVIFGFISNITFKSGQFVYYKTDKKLKKYLELMAYNLQKTPKKQDQNISMKTLKNVSQVIPINDIQDGNIARPEIADEPIIPLLDE
ncbi:Osw5p [Maudiozyma exigua]|uniref:Osw5p n=1 Tax=Maudiozyma exigua TaxID=34358 RepID=A0A9P7BCG0_MAUEX|nr:Osw5p [Kazachstania exigua]